MHEPLGTALLQGAAAGDEEALAAACSPPDPTRAMSAALREALAAVDRDGFTAVHLSAAAGHEGCVRLLLTAGAGIDVAGGKKGDTPLIYACRKGHAACARVLIEAGADLLKCNGGGANCVHIACWKGHAECARLCLEAGAGAGSADNDGATPLLVACQEGHADCARLCLEALVLGPTPQPSTESRP